MSEFPTAVRLLCDSSGLGKRYIPEPGDNTVDTLFALNLPLVTVDIVYAEVANAIRRYRNRNLGTVRLQDFNDARLKLRDEIFLGANVTLIPLTQSVIYSSIAIADKHNLNATDAALLLTFLNYVHQTKDNCVLLVSDLRFARAAVAEGLICLNPEQVAPDHLSAFFGSL